MKASEITTELLADYIKLDYVDLTKNEIAELDVYLNVAKIFISDYTGIPVNSVEGKSIDDYEDFVIVLYVLLQDMYDTRTLYVDKNNINKVVETILGMHRMNLL